MADKQDVVWIHGSASCATNTDPALQVHRLNANTYILRQNKCTHYEGPFMYLLLGEERALLLDTGARPVDGSVLPIAVKVSQAMAGLLLNSWLAAAPTAKGTA